MSWTVLVKGGAEVKPLRDGHVRPGGGETNVPPLVTNGSATSSGRQESSVDSLVARHALGQFLETLLELLKLARDTGIAVVEEELARLLAAGRNEDHTD